MGDELQLLERYLALMQIRMGARLAFEIDVPQDLRALPFAPLLLQPLVENAIEHGLEPKAEGGRVCISAERRGPRVHVEVRDNGLGSAARNANPSTDKGLGVANVRERLQALWGPSAQMRIDLADNGCTAALEFEAV